MDVVVVVPVALGVFAVVAGLISIGHGHDHDHGHDPPAKVEPLHNSDYGHGGAPDCKSAYPT